MTDFKNFRIKLTTTLSCVEQLAAKDKDPALHSIVRQLQYVDQWTKDGKRPNQEDMDRLSFGAMTSRTIHEVNPQLANEIYELSDFLIYWPLGKNY